MKNYQKGFIVPLVCGIVLLLVVGLGGCVYINKQTKAPVINQVENTVATTSDSSIINTQATSSVQKQSPVACTMDTKQCPDGTYIGRTGASCEFVCSATLINENAGGYIKSAYVKNGKNYIDIDYITFRHEAGDMPWGTIINDNPKIRTFEVSNDAKFIVNNDDSNKISFTDFIKIISNSQDFRSGNPWDIVVKDNLIISITENFRS